MPASCSRFGPGCQEFVLDRLKKAAGDAGNPFSTWRAAPEQIEELFQEMQRKQQAWMLQALLAWVELYAKTDGDGDSHP